MVVLYRMVRTSFHFIFGWCFQVGDKTELEEILVRLREIGYVLSATRWYTELYILYLNKVEWLWARPEQMVWFAFVCFTISLCREGLQFWIQNFTLISNGRPIITWWGSCEVTRGHNNSNNSSPKLQEHKNTNTYVPASYYSSSSLSRIQ